MQHITSGAKEGGEDTVMKNYRIQAGGGVSLRGVGTTVPI